MNLEVFNNKNIVLKVIYIAIIFSTYAHAAFDLSFKDNLKSSVMTFVVSTYFQNRGYGKIDAIKYDTDKKYLFIELSPEGEVQKLKIEIEKIDFLQEKENNQPKYYMLLKNMTTNRIWLNRILKDSASNGIKIPLSEQNYFILSAVL